ncbi:hypothetical protein AB6A40_004982 [Gnathostoma spinigerum]|uniref:Uncharacterized protein n=1 Tax=Gnathostoma spinigerum TaxID=75299 RepID=A0ABD6EE88_9BILA
MADAMLFSFTFVGFSRGSF